MSAPFSAVVMAGGRSTRMGRPKATLEFAGVPLWQRQVDVFAELGASEVLISAGADWSPGEGPWEIVTDRVPGLGPLGGLQAALGAMSSGRLLVLGVDMPAMSAYILGRLTRATGEKGIVPVVDGFYQGLAAIYPASIARLVDESLLTGDRSLQTLIGRAVSEGLVEALPIDDVDRPFFRNVNRPEDI